MVYWWNSWLGKKTFYNLYQGMMYWWNNCLKKNILQSVPRNVYNTIPWYRLSCTTLINKGNFEIVNIVLQTINYIIKLKVKPNSSESMLSCIN
jgi:hypothetical protein